MDARLHRAVVLTLTLILALAAVVPPACAGGCCAREHEASVHAQMPCCDSQPSFAPHDTTVVQRTPLAGTFVAPQLVAPLAIAILTPAISVVAGNTARDVEPAPPPPPFLLNAQFRI